MISLEPRPSGLGKAPALDVFGREEANKNRGRSPSACLIFASARALTGNHPKRLGTRLEYDKPLIGFSSVLPVVPEKARLAMGCSCVSRYPVVSTKTTIDTPFPWRKCVFPDAYHVQNLLPGHIAQPFRITLCLFHLPYGLPICTNITRIFLYCYSCLYLTDYSAVISLFIAFFP
jgi:hypothetical protein